MKIKIVIEDKDIENWYNLENDFNEKTNGNITYLEYLEERIKEQIQLFDGFKSIEIQIKIPHIEIPS